VLCVATDAPGTERLSVVRADPVAGGSIAAELLGKMLRGRGALAAFTGSLQTSTHAEYLHGFRETLAADFPQMRMAAAIETHDDVDEAYRKTLDLLSGGEPVTGIYVSTSNSPAVFRALDQLGRTGSIVMVTTDLSEAIAQRIRDGSVLASIYQRPKNQGRQAFRALYRFLVEGVCPAAQIHFSPHIVLRSNLRLFENRDAPVRSH
jgi:LacI family transcriptional regulator